MIEREKIIKLYDLYSELLTESQKSYFEEYYFEDLSLNEIAENKKVSKSFVGKTINKVTKKLENLETTLKLYEINSDLNIILKNTKDEQTKQKLEALIKEYL